MNSLIKLAKSERTLAVGLIKCSSESVKKPLRYGFDFGGLREQAKSVCRFTDEPVKSICWNDFARALLRGGRANLSRHDAGSGSPRKLSGIDLAIETRSPQSV
jgi:hypothetical protein